MAPQPQTAFQASLRPASFRGVPFGVIDSRLAAGRRGEVHEYPFRDTPYAEDLGRRAQRIQFTAFLLGDDVASQADRLLTAIEKKGPGELVHPSFPTRQMQVDQPAELIERWDKGRYIEVQLSFVEPGEVLYPTNDNDTKGEVSKAADNAETATIGEYGVGQKTTSGDAAGQGQASAIDPLIQIEGGGTAVTTATDPTLESPTTTSSASNETDAKTNAVETGKPTVWVEPTVGGQIGSFTSFYSGT